MLMMVTWEMWRSLVSVVCWEAFGCVGGDAFAGGCLCSVSSCRLSVLE